ncbi:MAG: metallophosphoesterase [Bacteroidales bacterium]|nr:metallophosphoesterase [Bacteroidales bacterium]
MRLPLLLILPLLILNALVDWYICRAVWRRCRRGASFWRPASLWSSVAFAVYFIVLILWPKRQGDNAQLLGLMWALYAYFSVYIPKYVFVILDLIGKIPALWRSRRLPGSTAVASGAALLVFAVMWWGALINRYSLDVNEIDVEIPGLPSSFDGMRVVQISDLHVGSFGENTAFVEKLVSKINSLEPDIIVFTGDLVNRRTDEALPFKEALSRLRAPFGVYSILGNHDYGDYYAWDTPEDKVRNMDMMKELQAAIGWKLLNNATEILSAGPDSIALIGVENIGDPPFPVYGDLEEAYPGDLADGMPKILLSHNPAHWEDDIADSPDKNIALTLSGHTHAMQIELLGWSPAVFRYDKWGGLYTDSDGSHSMYVNIGDGEVGIPARIGATPEITVITLQAARK